MVFLRLYQVKKATPPVKRRNDANVMIKLVSIWLVVIIGFFYK